MDLDYRTPSPVSTVRASFRNNPRLSVDLDRYWTALEPHHIVSPSDYDSSHSNMVGLPCSPQSRERAPRKWEGVMLVASLLIGVLGLYVLIMVGIVIHSRRSAEKRPRQFSERGWWIPELKAKPPLDAVAQKPVPRPVDPTE